jgi:hypothetical protein
MKLNRIGFAVLIFIQLISIGLNGQRASLDKVIKFKMRDIQAIEENGVVSGYFFFYTIDKENREENKYGLCVYDADFKQTHYHELIKPKKVELVDAKFNGEEYCFQLLDLEKKRYEFIVFNKSLEEVGKFLIPLPKEIAEAISEAAISGYGGAFVQTYTLISLPETGFGVYGMNPSTSRFELTAYNTAGDEVWKTSTGNTDKKTYEIGSLIFYDKDQITFEFLFYKNYKKIKEGERKLMRFDTKTGEKLSETALTGLKHYAGIVDQVKKEDGTVLCGEYYDEETKSEGIALISIADDGNITDEVYVSLKKDAANVLKDKAELMLLEDKSVLIHKVFITSDQTTLVIGEIFDKNYVYDLAIFEFRDNALQNIYLANKQKTNITSLVNTLNSTAGAGALMRIGLTNGSDYCYTSLNTAKTGFTTVYCNYEKEKKTGEYLIGSVSYTSEKTFLKRDTKLSTKPSYFTVLPAKPGYIALFEYFEKEKRVNMSLEKVQL